jgi:hypothetical protein
MCQKAKKVVAKICTHDVLGARSVLLMRLQVSVANFVWYGALAPIESVVNPDARQKRTYCNFPLNVLFTAGVSL